MKRFVVIVNGWKPLTIITKRSILDVAAALDPPWPLSWIDLFTIGNFHESHAHAHRYTYIQTLSKIQHEEHQRKHF